MVLETLVLGSLLTTAYRSEPRQTDDTPFHTSTWERVHADGLAVSQDMLCPASLLRDIRIRRHKAAKCHLKNKIHYGDLLHVEGIGFKIVNDCMNKRHKRHVDIWVHTYKQEKALKPARRIVTLVRGHS